MSSNTEFPLNFYDNSLKFQSSISSLHIILIDTYYRKHISVEKDILHQEWFPLTTVRGLILVYNVIPNSNVLPCGQLQSASEHNKREKKKNEIEETFEHLSSTQQDPPVE